MAFPPKGGKGKPFGKPSAMPEKVCPKCKQPMSKCKC